MTNPAAKTRISPLNKFGQFVYNPPPPPIITGPLGEGVCINIDAGFLRDAADLPGVGAPRGVVQECKKKKKYHRGSRRGGMRMKEVRVRVSEVTRSLTHTLTPCRQSLHRLIWAVVLALGDTPPREMA